MTNRSLIGRFKTIRLAFSFVPRKARGQWGGLIVLGLIASGLEAVAAMLIFSFIQLLLDPARVVNSRIGSYLQIVTDAFPATDPTVMLAMTVSVFYVVKNLFMAYFLYRQARIPMVSGAEFSRALFAAYMHAPYAYHLTKNSAEIQRNVGPAVDAAFRGVLFALTTILSELALVIGLIAVLLFVAPLTTLTALVAIGCVTSVIYIFTQGRIYHWGAEVQRLHKTMLQAVGQSIGGLKEIRISGREAHFIDEFAKQRLRQANLYARYTAAQQYPRLMLETVFIGLIGLVLLISRIGFGAQEGILPLLGLYAYTGFRIMPSLNRILIGLQNVKFGTTAIQDVHFDISALTPPAIQKASAAEKHSVHLASEIKLHGISFHYPLAECHVLHDINLVIRRGESVGIVGSTGAGKSTLLDIILGLLEPDAGELLVDGKSIKNDMARWQHLIGYVPQMVFLLDDSLKRNIALGVPDSEIDESRINAVIRTTQLEDVVAGMPAGIETVVGERGIRLSGGQRQRVAIARALYHRPEVLALDEATAALDNRTELYLSEAVQKLSGAMTLIIVAHRLNTIRHCNRIFVMQDGTIVDTGSYDELMARSAAFRNIAAHAVENKGQD